MGINLMRKLFLLLTLTLIASEAFGAYSKNTWKNTDQFTELVRSGAPVKIGNGCFRYNVDQLESSNDCIVYDKIGAVDVLNDIGDVDTTGATDGQALVFDFGSSTWIPGTVDSLPTQTNKERQILRTDGINSSWTTELQDWQASVAVPYRVGEVVVESGNIYKCITPNNDAVFDPLKWQSIGGGSLPTDLVTTDETTILTDFAAAWDNVAKKVKSTLVSLKDNFVKAVGFIGNYTNPDNFAVQTGENYNATDSTLAGGASVSTSEISVNLYLATMAMSATNTDSLMMFDAVTDPQIYKGAWYAVHVNYGISGTESEVVQCAVYDNGVKIAGQYEPKLSGTDNQTKRAKIQFQMPASPTKIQVGCEQIALSVGPQSFSVTQLVWDKDPDSQVAIPKSATSYEIYNYSVVTQSGAVPNLRLKLPAGAFIRNTGAFEVQDNASDTQFNVLKDSVVHINSTVVGVTGDWGIIEIFNSNGTSKRVYLGQQTTTGAIRTNITQEIEMKAGEYFKVGVSDYTAVAQHQLTITAIPQGADTGIVGEGEIPSNVVILKDVKPASTDGGSSIAGTQQRVLNTIEGNTGIISGLSSNQFTLPKGEYEIEVTAPAWKSQRHQVFIYNVTDASNAVVGSNAYTNDPESVQTSSAGVGSIKLDTQKTFEVRHYTQAARSTDGLGVSNNVGSQVYTQVKITKLSGVGPTTVLAKSAVIHEKNPVKLSANSVDVTLTGGAFATNILQFTNIDNPDYTLESNGTRVKRSGRYKVSISASYFNNNEIFNIGYVVNSGSFQSGNSINGDSNASGSDNFGARTYYVDLVENDLIQGAIQATNAGGSRTYRAYDMTIELVDQPIETGFISTSKSAIPENQINLTESEYKCSSPNSPVEVFCRWIYFPSDVTSTNTTYLNVGTGLTPVDSLGIASNEWVLPQSVTYDPNYIALVSYRKATGFISVTINNYTIPAGTRIKFMYTRD